jgi:hypothetical protein
VARLAGVGVGVPATNTQPYTGENEVISLLLSSNSRGIEASTSWCCGSTPEDQRHVLISTQFCAAIYQVRKSHRRLILAHRNSSPGGGDEIKRN